jgi:D-alanyl-D-alanine carboxypeptidase
MRRAGALIAVLAFAGCGGGGAGTQAAHGGRTQVVAGPLQVSNGPVKAADPGDRPLALALTGASDRFRVTFKHPPRGGLLFDLDTGEVLWRHQPDRVLPIASLTKMMTALLVVDRAAPDAKVRVTKEALAYKGSAVGVLPKGKRIKLETMLNGLLLPSGNDAAIALAQRMSGTVAGFVRHMNERAGDLGLTCTRFSSPDGFKDAGNHSCAIDLAEMARAVLDRPRLARIVERRRAVLPFPI